MTSGPRERWKAAAYWTTPSVLCLVIYWYGLRSWFRMDDFAWLGLHTLVHDFPSFLTAMFQPLAQGTIRPLSERLFFFLGWHLFGMEALPFRAIAFLTMFGCLALLTAVTRRLTGSAVAGFLAPVLWLANGNLYVAMTWNSAYNQILCAFTLLLALLLWIRYTDTGERRFYVWQWVVFVLGFGVLEIVVVYPALAALHALCFARNCLRKTAPMFVASAVYTAVNRTMAPAQRPETYQLYFDLDLFGTLAKYLRWSFGADRYAEFRGLSPALFYAAEAVVAAALAAFVILMLRRRRWLAAFGTAWFFIAIAPVLPLKRHVSDYYVTIPVIGFAILGAWAIAEARRRWVVAAIALLYVAPSVWMAQGMSHHFYGISRRAANFVRSVAYAHRVHPQQRLMIRNVDHMLYWSAWQDNPFRIFGLREIYISAEDRARIDGASSQWFLPQTVALEGMKRGQVLAYDVLPDGRLRNVTALLRPSFERRALPWPRRLDLRDPLSAPHLLSGWWQAEAHHRWMSRRARFQLAGPAGERGELILRGQAPQAVTMVVSVNGRTFVSRLAAGVFEVRYGVGRAPELDIALEVDRTIVDPGDGRELGLIFGAAEVIP